MRLPSRLPCVALAALLVSSVAFAGARGLTRNREGAPSRIAARYLPTISTADECTCAAIPGVTVSRSSSGTCTKSDGTLVTCSADQPRVEADGLLVEASAINYFLNSGSPTTQSLTLATGTYTGWVDRTGSETMALAVGTATATGLPCTAGASDCTFTVTGAGTVSATITGTPTRAQVENSGFRTSYIATAGTSATRAADVASVSKPAGMTDAAGCVAATVKVPATLVSGVRIIGTTGSNALAFTGTGYQFFDGTNLALATAAVSGQTRQIKAAWSGVTSSVSDDAGNSGASSYDGAWLTSTLYLGSQNGTTNFLNSHIRNIIFGRSVGACQ